MKIAFLGPKGTFSEEALTQLIVQNKWEANTVPAQSITTLFKLLDDGSVDKALIPLENAIEGPVTQALDLLIDHQDLWITEEIDLEIIQSLFVSKGDSHEITDLISFPHALAQCRQYLNKELPHVTLHHASSTAASVEMMMDLQKTSPDKQFGVIGKSDLANTYDLDCVETAIQDIAKNITKFGLIEREQKGPTGHDKTAIVFSTRKDIPGSLHAVLGEFSSRKINLSKIVSRPNKITLGDYLFFVDFDGHIEDPLINDAITAIQQHSLFYRHLGSYRRLKPSDD